MIASNVIADHVIIGGADEAFLEVDAVLKDGKGAMNHISFSSPTSCSVASTSASKVSSISHHRRLIFETRGTAAIVRWRNFTIKLMNPPNLQ
jgi:hypothetical protein